MAHQLATCAIDFDGVIHWYRKGWHDGTIYDDVVPGFFAWARRAKEEFHLAIYSIRARSIQGVEAMQEWLVRQHSRESPVDPSEVLGWFEFAYDKPSAVVYIDDRAVRFNGIWTERYLEPKRLSHGRTWIEIEAAKPVPAPPLPAPPPVPTVGRTVRYVQAGTRGAGEMCPAIVTRVINERTLNLYVIPDNATPFTATSIVQAGETPAARTWKWPERV